MLVYILNYHGRPLMPCSPRKARILLKEGKAKVIKRTPFTIQLLYGSSGYTQPIIVGVDKGSKETGVCCVANGIVLLSAIISHRSDISDKMTSRRENRRNRRTRKWYRKPRFLNRASSNRSGRIPPSIKTNIDEVLRVLKKINLPIYNVIVEDVLIDIAKLNDPEKSGRLYQQSNRLHENLRMATLLRDKFVCQSCKKKTNQRLQAHHIVPSSEGGLDSIHNLMTLCQKCHSKVHLGKISITGGRSGLNNVWSQRSMQGKSYLYSSITNYFGDVKTVYGYQTSEHRKLNNLPKEHDVDAFCIATMNLQGHWIYNKDNFYNIKFRPRQTRQQYFTQPRKGQGRVKYQVNESLGGFHKGDIVFVKGQYIKQINSIYSNGLLAFPRVCGEPGTAKPMDCKLVEKQSTIMWVM